MRYEAPSSLDQAVALLTAEPGDARVLAGGTDLLVQMRTDLIEPVLVVDIKGIAETRQIKEEGGGFRIGAAVTGAELKEHPRLKTVWPGVVEAANLIGSTQIQGRASMGGNLCNGSPAADSVPALIAAGAKASVVGPKGRRELAVEDVMLAPRKLALTKGEIVASFLLPAKPARTADAYLRFIPRTEMDIAVVGCGVCLTLDAGGTCTAARVALGAVAPRPLLVADAAKALIGSKVDAAALQKLDAAARAACRPIDDKRGTKDYRIKVAGVLARRTAADCARTGEESLDDEASHNGDGQRRPRRVSLRDAGHAARLLARSAGPHRHQGGLLHRRLRRLQRHGRQSAGMLLPDAGRGGRRQIDRHHRGHGPGRDAASRCSASSWSTRHFSAASAPRAS